jgi:hypothetical protein
MYSDSQVVKTYHCKAKYVSKNKKKGNGDPLLRFAKWPKEIGKILQNIFLFRLFLLLFLLLFFSIFLIFFCSLGKLTRNSAHALTNG